LKTKNTLGVIGLIVLFANLLIPWMPARAAEWKSLPAFSDFVTTVTNGQAGVVSGVYVPGVMAYQVVQQLANNPGYISPIEGVVTQFNMAVPYGAIGLLAHNYLAGENFINLQAGQEVRIIYGDGTITSYTINSIHTYQALDSHNTSGKFVDLNSGAIYSASEMFAMYYQGGDHVTFQTCFLKDGNSSWGRLFITAIPSAPVHVVETNTNISHFLLHGK